MCLGQVAERPTCPMGQVAILLKIGSLRVSIPRKLIIFVFDTGPKRDAFINHLFILFSVIWGLRILIKYYLYVPWCFVTYLSVTY